MREEGGVKRVGSFMVEAGHNLRKNGCCVVGECFRLYLELKAISKLFIYEPPGKSPLRPEAKPKTPEVAAAVDCQREGQISPWGPFTLGFKTTLAGWSARADEGISALKEL